MHRSVDIVIEGASPHDVFEQVSMLDRYPAWMRLVHKVEPLEPDGGRPAWWVELRARVGPFARSKQLRMVRVAVEPDRAVRFERIQPDDRDHADWTLSAHLTPTAAGTAMTMELSYTGELWSSGLLGRVLEEEIKRGRKSLRKIVLEA